MSKGPSQVGTQTTTTNSTPWNSTQLSDLYSRGQNLLEHNPITNFSDPSERDAFNGLIGTGASLGQTLVPQSNNAWSNILGGSAGVQNSPAYGGLSDIGAGNTAGQRNLGSDRAELGNIAAAAGNNPASNLLLQSANGNFLNANPFVNRMYGAASDAVRRQYMTATAPQTDSAFEGAGRYGSGAAMNARSQNEQNLGSTLGNLASNIYGQNYANERGLQQQAQSTLGSQYLSGIGAQTQARQAAGALDAADTAGRSQALGALQSGYQSGNANQLAALGLTPNVLQSNVTPDLTALQGAQGLSQLGRNAETAPWDTLRQYGGLLGNTTFGSSTASQPIYGANPVSQGIGALGAIAPLLLK